MHGLRSDVDWLIFGGVEGGGERGHGGAEDDLGVMMMCDEGKEGVDECDGFGWGLEHLPVGGN